MDDWFRSTLDSKMIESLLDSGSRIYRYLQANAAGTLLDEHPSGRHDHHTFLFSLTVFEEWMRVNESPVQV
jgi:hypothetical protein